VSSIILYCSGLEWFRGQVIAAEAAMRLLKCDRGNLLSLSLTFRDMVQHVITTPNPSQGGELAYANCENPVLMTILI
jgi:hypothetical protein